MPIKIILTIVEGQEKGRQWECQPKTSCLIGRGSNCDIMLPSDREHIVISRHHCLINIKYPQIHIKDLGSRNGTYVNGKLIGKRKLLHNPTQGLKLNLLEYELKSGDKIKLGNTVFKVEVEKKVILSPALKGSKNFFSKPKLFNDSSSLKNISQKLTLKNLTRTLKYKNKSEKSLEVNKSDRLHLENKARLFHNTDSEQITNLIDNKDPHNSNIQYKKLLDDLSIVFFDRAEQINITINEIKNRNSLIKLRSSILDILSSNQFFTGYILLFFLLAIISLYTQI